MRSVIVEFFVVNNAARRTIRFASYYHRMAPGNWVIYWNSFKNTYLHISVQTSLDISLPVEWDLPR